MAKAKGKKISADRKAFNKLCGDHQEAFADAQADASYVPPPGDYTRLLKRVDTGVFTPKKGDSKGIESVKVSPIFEIAEGELEGRTFSQFLSTTTPGILKSQIAALLGEVEEDLAIAVERLEAEAVEQLFTVRAIKKGKYTNIYVQERLEDDGGGSPDDDDDADDSDDED